MHVILSHCVYVMIMMDAKVSNGAEWSKVGKGGDRA